MAREDTNRIALGLETDTVKKYQRALNQREKKLAEAVLYDENIDDDFSSALVVSNFDNDDGTIWTGAAEETLGFHSGRYGYEYRAAAGTAAVLAPFQSADGLELQPVITAGACEITNGTTALSKAAYTVGSFLGYKKIFMEATIKIDTVTNVTELWCGWRKAEAYQTDPDLYDELAAFNIGKDGDGQIEIHTILNNATTDETDTAETDWAASGEHTLRIEVDNNGNCAFYYDGSTPSTTTTFQFDSGEVILPFCFLDTESAAAGVSISKWTVGYM